MFSNEFYPTPANVIEIMTADLDLTGKTVLEPSAGKGDIIDFCKRNHAKVLACELHPELAIIASRKTDSFLCNDFFNVKPEQVSHVDYIIMNPPFSNADKHIKHAYEIAPEGCVIVALCNVNTLGNKYSRTREDLGELIEKNGYWQSLGNCFSQADRHTDVEVAMVKIHKPKTGDNEFDNYFFEMNDEQEETINGSGIVRHNEIREIVNRYVCAVKMFDNVIATNTAINDLMLPISKDLKISFGAHDFDNRYTAVTRDFFKKELQKSAWKSIFAKMGMYKYVTSGVMADINRFVEQQQAVPFTMANVYKMIEIIFGTHASRMDRVLVEAFDHICNLSADNSEAGKGWKTNSNYKVNRRFIDTCVCEYDSRWPADYTKIRCGHRDEVMTDIIKGLCYLTGKKYDDVMFMEYSNDYGSKYTCQKTLYSFFSKNKTPWGEWVQWNDFFRVRGYKKGTMHFEFVDENVWMEFNRRVAKIKGWQLPTKTNNKNKGTERTKKTGVTLL